MIEKKLLKTTNGNVELTIDETIHKFKGLVFQFIKGYIKSNDYDDLEQTGLIAISKAYEDYDITKDKCFSTIATLYIRNAISKYIRSMNTKKNTMVTCSLDDVLDDSEDMLLLKDCIKDKTVNVENIVVSNIFFNKTINTYLEKLTQPQYKAMMLSIKGLSNEEIANILDKKSSAISTLLGYTRNKLQRLLNSNGINANYIKN